MQDRSIEQRTRAAYRARACAAGVACGAQIFAIGTGLTVPLALNAAYGAAVPALLLGGAIGLAAPKRLSKAPGRAFCVVLAVSLLVCSALLLAAGATLAQQTLLPNGRLLTSLMLVLGLIERQFPLTAAIPGIKLGLANSVLIYALYMLGVKQSIVLMLLKAMMSWLIYTNMQAMFYSLAGGVLSLLAMIALSRIKGVSVIGVSALGAVGFNIGQILMAVAMLHTPQLIVTYLPVLMVSGVATGVLTGVVAQMVMKHLKVIEKKA